MDAVSCKASCSNNAQQSSSSGASSDEADALDEDSSSSSCSSTIRLELEHYREIWKMELTQNLNQQSVLKLPWTEEEREEQASILFLRGAKAERSKSFHEAIFYYRRALKLVPDIEERLAKQLESEDTDEEVEKANEDLLPDDDDEDERSLQDNLYEHIQKMQQDCNTICVPEREQKGTHISSLPPEVFSYILQWVVSSVLDLRSLEQCSTVCRGFYLRARDPEIWRLACAKVWGAMGNTQTANYPSWRDMYIQRPRVCCNGLYISRTTYFRQGDPTTQGYFYKPCYLVAYFRYLRFYPNGVVLMLTTLDDPYQALDKLQHNYSLPPTVLRGKYNQHGTVITAVLEKASVPIPLMPKTRRYRQAPVTTDDPGHQTYHLEVELRTVKNRLNGQLVWNHYSVHTLFRNNKEMTTTFEITPSTFPPFWFSPVRSYTSESHSPLVP